MIQLDFLVFFCVVHLHVTLVPGNQVGILGVDTLAVLCHDTFAVFIQEYFQPAFEPDMLSPAFRVLIHAQDGEMLHIFGRQIIIKHFLDNIIVPVYTVMNPALIRGGVCTHQQVTAVGHTLVVTFGRIVVPTILGVVEYKSGNVAGIPLVAGRAVILFHRPVGPGRRLL